MALLLVLAWALPSMGGWLVDGQPNWSNGAADDATFPVLRLEMGGQWTDFELMASTNNFQSYSGLVYYIKSSGPTACPDDTNVWIYFVDDCSTNPKTWTKSVYGSSIFSQLADPTNSQVSYVVVCPSHDCVVDWRTWMSRTNNQLVWSFVRYDGIGLQTNAAGTNLHYNLTIPVEWRRERIAP
ncbi:MAG: hypothetical protein NTV49_04410 [Kiritimatiellaeota bacterium]|nr:hypothetical protein [Kiritimatiellota bacterium]